MNFSVPINVHLGVFGWAFAHCMTFVVAMWICRMSIKRAYTLSKMDLNKRPTHPAIYVPLIIFTILAMIFSTLTLMIISKAVTDALIG